MINEKIFLCQPILFENKFFIYPPKVQEVIALGAKFSQYLKVLTITQEELNDEFVNMVDENGEPIKAPTPLEFLIASSYEDETFKKIAEDSLYFFLHQKVLFLTDIRQVVIGELTDKKKVEEIPVLNEENYFNFQNSIRIALGNKKVEPPAIDEDPRVTRIKAKARLRDRIKLEKGGGISISTSLVSLCCMGIGLNPLNIGEISYASVGALISTYQEKEKYETDIASLLAGADSKKVKPKYWIRNLD